MFAKALRYALYAVGTLCVLAALLYFGALYALHHAPFRGTPFDAAAWRTALSCKTDKECLQLEMACLRGPMVADIQASVMGTKATRDKVVALLGPSLQHNRVPKNCVEYELGYCSGFKIDADYLRICFDRDNRSKSVVHWQS